MTFGQHTHTFVAFLKEAETVPPSGITIDWIGFPAVPDQVLDSVQVCMFAIDTACKPLPPTEVMDFIRKMKFTTGDVYGIADFLRSTEDVTNA